MKLGNQSGTAWTPLLRSRLMAGLQRVVGFDPTPFDPTFVEATLERRRLAIACESPRVYVERVAGGDVAEAIALVESLQVHYTEFFRDPIAFALVERRVLPELVRQRRKRGRELRVWSAGCGAGQEAYSVAILLLELAGQNGHNVPFRVIATDANETQLANARAGTFDVHALRSLRVGQVERWFVPQGTRHTIGAEVRAHVDFSSYDLLDDRSLGPPQGVFVSFDLVLCCNVLFYYRAKAQRALLRKLTSALVPGGYLVVGETELDVVAREGRGFARLEPSTAVFRRGFV